MTMGGRLAMAFGIIAAMSVAAGAAKAQQSNFGTIDLTPGFVPDPHVARGTSGGAQNASTMSNRCRGWISRTPDHILVTRRDFDFLRIFAEAAGDTTLVIQNARGHVLCDDDTYGRNPSIEGDFPAGAYRVWIGSYSQGENVRYELKLTELQSVTPGSNSGASGNTNASPGGADRGLQIDATRGNFDPVTLRSGFTPDPVRKSGVSGGELNSERLGNGCRGWIAGRPDHVLRLQGNFNFFRIFVNSDSDTTLVVRMPNGRFVCNDDTNGLNPAISRNRWRRGLYRVWVGSYQEGDNSRYNIGFTELQSVTE
jgi:hypothetical protein